LVIRDRQRTSTGWFNEKGIASQIPVIDKSNRNDGTLTQDDFSFDKERNVYVCAKGS
jgi:hypothetical protein